MKTIVYTQRITVSSGKPSSMDAIEQKLLDLLQSGKKFSLQDLGGLNACHKLSNTIAKSRLMDEFFHLLMQDAGIPPSEQSQKLFREIIMECLACSNDQVALRNSIEHLCSEAERFIFTFDILLKRAGEISIMPIIRGYFLLGAFAIASKSPTKKFSLIAYLITVDKNDSREYLKYVSKIIGLSHTAFQIEELASKLSEFVSENIGEDDALYELGIAHLTKGLGSATHQHAMQQLQKALSYFQLAAGIEDRQDAGVLCAAIEILKGFIDNKEIADLKEHLQKLNKCITLYTAWHTYTPAANWFSLRNTELFHWYELSNYLTHLLEQLTIPAWFEPIIVIEKYLLRIYDCSRSVFLKDKEGGLELLIRPTITAGFIDKPEKVFLLEQWLKTTTNKEFSPIAQQLWDDISNFKSKWISGNVKGAVSDSLIDAVPSITLIAESQLSEFEKFTASYRKDHSSTVSLILQAKFNELVEELKTIDSYNHPEINREFNTILFHTLRFLELRMDNTVGNHPKARYLFENDILPKEDVLQNDYYEFMQPITLNGKVRVELSDIGGGRADVYFDYLSFSFCTEVKRDWTETSFAGLRSKYLGQAKEYQNTTAKVGILLVLDLIKKTRGIGSLESNVKLEIISSDLDPVHRGVVVIKVPGNRLSPSSVKLKT